MEKIVMITLFTLTFTGKVEMTSFEVVSKDSCASWYNHNIKSLFARILGRRCPMIDIEHIYLFDKSTMNRLLSNHGLEVEIIESLYSAYSIGYAVKMFPFPKLWKETILKFCEWTKLNNLEVRFPGGNMVSIARKSPFAN